MPHVAAAGEDPAKWLQSKLQLSPTPLSVQSSCPALNATTNALPWGVGVFGTLSAIGTLHLRPGGVGGDPQLLKDSDVLQWLEGVSDLIRAADSDHILASFPTLIQRTDDSHQVLK